MMITPINSSGSYNSCKPKPQSFTGAESKFKTPLRETYDKYTTWLAKNYVNRLHNNDGITKWAKNWKDKKNAFTHMMTVGSILTSGTYMVRTLNNKKLDKDRKQTLAINQGLTLGGSIALTYGLENKLNNWWDDQKVKFAGAQLDDKDFCKDFKAAPKTSLENFISERYAEAKHTLADSTFKKLFSKGEFAALKPETKYETVVKKMRNRLEGMNVLKTAMIFGLIYRYIVPVVATPIANKIGNHYLAKKKAKEAASGQAS